MTEVGEKIAEATGNIENELAQYSILNLIEKKTKVPKTAVVVFTGLTLFTLVYAMFGPGLLCNLVGFVYPAYASFQAVESQQKDDDTQWLTYWVVYATFTVFEAFVDLILFWVPMYYSFKFGFLIWLFLPNTQGAKFLYDNVISPVFKANESTFDSVMGSAAIKEE
uniref:Receptor expression-enhancing protein n=1 Tax=Aplanochytrium stocchinoi TaxID=215587 RepID=A0A7S3PQQ3_9STRA|mmetsp:Transcript_3416/g.4307  ORF Transcript_3416/g.4307 Transcript_3416/m.4307 type:complete len:166 (+) Transcript_3416:131-628(+)|eukprot:CAMPEP_0204880080 /NCGR_PEP_ID=MMETSP1349-20130617/1509_1 /ASSEMBLY_ACC=CAM_ASM_000710 /TAXON_ID=215587 /ORGANISM="Aplanochytrium stocchinoi, Strain GSBS06" /LENGTH=165 /DNA_ID=CAMNT_0052038319 /DNA_START=53 /DNA_END=550 /DNA_ORIENTATION=-